VGKDKKGGGRGDLISDHINANITAKTSENLYMNTKKAYSVYFSPTGTTEKAANAIASGTGLPYERIDLTILKKRQNFKLTFNKSDLVIAGTPVYGGRIPKNIDNFFSGLNGNGAPAVALVVYGNREYEDALIELKIRLEERGFQVIAGAAFIGEHTYSKKIAGGRPDANDLKTAGEFGGKIIREIDKATRGKLTVKGNYPYIVMGNDPAANMGPIATIALVTATEDCTLCGICAEECPWGAITIGDIAMVDYTKCSRCLRCIKVCPAGALKINNPKYHAMVAGFEDWLKGRHREPELFFPE
jgi:ferredoxin